MTTIAMREHMGGETHGPYPFPSMNAARQYAAKRTAEKQCTVNILGEQKETLAVYEKGEEIRGQ